MSRRWFFALNVRLGLEDVLAGDELVWILAGVKLGAQLSTYLVVVALHDLQAKRLVGIELKLGMVHVDACCFVLGMHFLRAGHLGLVDRSYVDLASFPVYR